MKIKMDPAQRRAGGNLLKFIAGLLALTLIARGTSGATLAKVELSGPSRNEIVEAVTGSATVSARDAVEVKAPEGLTILEILVGVGQTAQYGDAVALFDMVEIETKLIRENAALDRLLIDLERLEREADTDSASLESSSRNLARARDDYNTTRAQGESDIAAAYEALEEELEKLAEDPDAAALDTAWRNLSRAQEDFDSTKIQGDADVLAARNALEAARNSRPDSLDTSAIDSASRSLSRAEQDYYIAVTQGRQDEAAAEAALQAAQAHGDQAEIDRAREALNSARARANDSILTAWRRLEDAQASLDRAQQDYYRNSQQASDSRQTDIDRARDALDTAHRRAEENLLSAARRLEDAEIALDRAQQAYSDSSLQASDNRQASIDRARDALETARRRAEENLTTAARRVEDAEASLRSAEQNYQNSERQSAETVAINDISAISLRLDIDDQQAIVDALNMLAADNGVLRTDVAGVVSAVKNAGSVTGRDALIAFIDGTQGYEAVMRLDKADAEKLAVGDECQVTTGGGSMYYNPTVTGIISAI